MLLILLGKKKKKDSLGSTGTKKLLAFLATLASELSSACLYMFLVEILCCFVHKLPPSFSEHLLGQFPLQVLAFNSAKFLCFLLIIASTC